MKKGLNAFQLKMGMAALMVLDHIHQIPHLLSPNTASLFHLLTRCVAVWFAFAATEGFIHTRNRIRYTGRLFLWAGMMFLGNTLLSFCFQEKGIVLTNNIFLTLACGVLMLGVYFGFSTDSKPTLSKNWLIGATGIFLIVAFLIEGGIVLLPFMLISYLFRHQKKRRTLFYFILLAVLFALSFELYPTWQETLQMLLYNSDWFFISVLPFLYLYNGERGLQSKWSKYFFYLFYPAHLWVIATIAFFVT